MLSLIHILLNDTDWLIDADSLADTEILNESETDSEILADADWLTDADLEVEREALNDPETDSETLIDADWLSDSESEVETDSLVETEVLNESETDSEILEMCIRDRIWRTTIHLAFLHSLYHISLGFSPDILKENRQIHSWICRYIRRIERSKFSI